VLAIKNAQTYERAEAGERSREAYREVAKKIIAQEGNHEEVIGVILKEARGLINAEIGIFQQYENGQPSAFYIDAENEEIHNALYNGLDRDQISGILDQGIVRHVADTKEPYTTLGRDAQDDEYYKGSPHIHSETAVPLLGEDNTLIGVLDLESPRPFAFRADDERVLDLFGELTVIAFKNARNYSRAKMESKRFSLLYEAGRELSEITDPSKLNVAYSIVIEKMGEFSDGEAVIRCYDPGTEALLLADVGGKRATEPMPSIPKSEGVNGQVARELRTIRIDDFEHLPPGVAQPIGDDPAIKALVVTPLIFERFYYGNLVLSHEQANSFNDADISLLEGLARQLAITIHRLEIVKAIREAEQHAKNLRVMSEVGQSALEVAHRLGNELKPVEIYVENIWRIIENKGIKQWEIEANLDKVGKDVKSLIHMARELRHKIADLARLEGELERSSVPVTALLENVEWSSHSPENVTVRLEIKGDLPEVSVVPGLVIDILRNLFTNAVEAMPEGGTITIRASYDRPQAGNSSQYVLIEVEDTGTGVPPEMQPKVFNLFFSTKKSSGFGLWSARQYARANGGELKLSRSEEQVTTFALMLPVAPKQ